MKYELLDSGNFQKLEQVGPYKIVRPAAQAVWRPRLDTAVWKQCDASFKRFSGGDGKWDVLNKKLPEAWKIQSESTTFNIELTDFGHLGIFPEQESNWDELRRIIKASSGEFKVLNLFAYTGGSTLASAAGGAQVVHVDASKTSVAWARKNAEASGLDDRPIRWIVDDVQKFVEREVRRGSIYQGIILDPPSFGRGAKNEVWQIEQHLVPLLDELAKLTNDSLKFILLSAHSNGYTPLALSNLLEPFSKGRRVSLHAKEMVLPEKNSPRGLPSGASCLLTVEDSR
jgi:23S rRNA (cytosine1962-C5)-methyltransferase